MNRLDATAPPTRAGATGRIRRRPWAVVRRSGAVAGTAALVALGPAAPAHAHVDVEPSTTEAGATAVLEFSVSHGCGESPTIGLTIQIPDGINAATPTRDALWKAKKRTVALDPPVTDAHGNQVTERVESVTFTTDAPLVDGLRDTVQLSVQIPDAEGSTLAFPVIQKCQGAETAWIEVAEAGLDEDELELPAPAFTITAAGTAGAAGSTDPVAAATPGADSGEDEDTEAQASAGAGDGDGVAFVALALGLLGAVLGAAALVMQRRAR